MSDTDPDAQSGDEGAQGGTGESGTGTGEGTAGDPKAQSGDAGSKAETVAREDFERLREQLRAADKRRDEFEKELKQIRDKDLPAVERLQREADEAAQAAEKTKQELDQTRLELAFFKSNKHKWQNPATALKLADLSKVTVEDDGTVTGLDAAIEALAKSDPYLLKPETDEKEKPKGSTGTPGTAGKSGGDDGPDLKKMATRIPALRSRMTGT